MPEERRIEKLLRAFAKKRKADAGAPLELHPATRRLLQGEVARQAKGRPPTEQVWWRFWFGTPRRAFTVCALMSVLISGTVFLTTMKSKQPAMNLAKNENKAIAGKPMAGAKRELAAQPAPVATPPAPETPAPASPAPPATLADRKAAETDVTRDGGAGGGGGGGMSGVATTTTPATSANASSAIYDDYVVTNSTAATFALNEPVGQAVDKAKVDSLTTMQKDVSGATFGSVGANREAASTSAAIPALDTEKQLIAEAKAPQSNIEALNFASGYRFKNMGALKANTGFSGQQFYRVKTATDKAANIQDESAVLGTVKKQSVSDVLDSFSVKQDGNKITVVDSDGSQYSGFIQPVALSGELADVPAPAAPVTTTRRRAGGITSAAAMNVAPSEAENYAFTVTGTNLSLHQLVVFSGNFVALTNGVVTRNGLMTNAVVSDALGPQPRLQNSRIEGRADVGPRKKKTEVKIEATPAGP